jgi:hypothetical protein
MHPGTHAVEDADADILNASGDRIDVHDGLPGACDLMGRFPFGNQGSQKGPLLQVGLKVQQHLPEHLVALDSAQVLLFDQPLDVPSKIPQRFIGLCHIHFSFTQAG